MSTKEGISKVFASKIFHTVRKFHNFSITEILREINFEDSVIAKTAILGALNFVNLVNFSLQKVLRFIKIKIQNL